MNAQTDSQLLIAYARQRLEPAFAELVRRHVDFVYSAAVRMVRDPHLAEDATQGVFIALARQAPDLAERATLAGWLHRTAQNLAAQTVRTIERRRVREQEAVAMNELISSSSDASWELIQPHLDAAFGELSDADRDAVFLRYYEKKSATEMAGLLGITNDAAQKRVSRAVDRLRECFARRGIAVGASGLAALLSAHAIQAAPAGLAFTISTAAAVAETTVAAATATVTKAIAMTALQKTLVAATVTILAGAGIYEARQAAQLRAENERLRVQQEQLTAARDTALATVAGKEVEWARIQKERTDLLRLRNEVGMLRRQTNEVAQLRADNRQLRTSLAQAVQAADEEEAEKDSDPQRQMAIAKLNDARLLVLALLTHADAHQNQLPTDWAQTSNFWATADQALSGTNEFEVVLRGSLTSITNPSEVIAVREKEPLQVNGKWIKTYGFADGHSEVKVEPPEGFEDWEREHILPPPPGQ